MGFSTGEKQKLGKQKAESRNRKAEGGAEKLKS